MPLELRWKLNGSLRPFWYGRYEVNGKRYCHNLGVKIAGSPPASQSLKDEGDAAFERSRATALAKLNGIIEEAQSKRNAVAIAEKLYEIKTGEVIKSVKLDSLVSEWRKIPRRRELNAIYAAQCESTVNRFVEYVKREHPKVVEAAQVSRSVALGFLEAEAKRGITGKTWNDKLKVLRLLLRHALPPGAIHPLMEVPTRESETVFRHPFTPEELGRITEVAKTDEFIRPIIVAGMCTAMRRGDCCLLQWKDVDLKNRFITVKASKTGQSVSIPIFPMLQIELDKRAGSSSARGATEDRGARKAMTGYVFPEQAEAYLRNPDGITLRVKRVLAVALSGERVEGRGMKDENEGRTLAQHGEGGALPAVSEAEVRERGKKFIVSLPEGEKRVRMAAVFDSYMTGKSLDDVATATGVSKTSVSDYLNEIESGSGCQIVRGRPDGRSMTAVLKAAQGFLRADRAGGKRRASVRDFHSFRVTWVTLALTAGVPLELVQKVTGHKTTDIVLKHYFQPGREAFREALNKAMPALLMNGETTEEGGRRTEAGGRKAEAEMIRRAWETERSAMREIVRRSTAQTWKKDRRMLLALLRTTGETRWGELEDRGASRTCQ
jgi:integrase